jgi:type II secretory pathway pseudopilin PulG
VHKSHLSGITLLESLITVAVIGALALFAAKGISFYKNAINSKDDDVNTQLLRQHLTQEFSCQATLKVEKDRCEAGSEINLYGKGDSQEPILRSGAPLRGKASVFRLKATCQRSDDTYEIKVVYKRDDGPYKVLNNELPYVCKRSRTGWYIAHVVHCPTFCADLNMTNTFSPRGSKCASGEHTDASAKDLLTYPFGCWWCCCLSSGYQAKSYGNWCYRDGQKWDFDRTDLTVGCHCSAGEDDDSPAWGRWQ